MMKKLIQLGCLHALLMVALAGSAQQPTGTPPAAAAPVFRGPFTVRFTLDKGRTFEANFDKVPYVVSGSIHLFVGEKFGVNVTVSGDEFTGVTYQPDLKKADVEFTFTREGKGRDAMMMLMIKNKLKKRLFMDAEMMVPESKGMHRTSILPVEAGLSSFESWPEPIVWLILENLRFTEVSAGK